MRRQALWIGLVGLALVLGTVVAVRATHFTFPPLRTRAFPGFDVDLPYGPKDADDKNYANGRANIGSIAGLTSSAYVRWEPGDLYTDDEVALARKALALVLHNEALPLPITTEIAVPGKNRTRSWAARAGGQALWTTQIACGVRRVMVTTAGRGDNVERLHRRVAGSFHCRPDAARERTAGQVPVAFDVGAGWFRQASSAADVRITNRRFSLLARVYSSGGITEDIPADIRAFVEATTPTFKFGERVGDDWAIRVDVDGEELHGWMTVRPCPDTIHLLLISLGDADRRDDSRALLKRARCRRPDEAPQTWPELPDQADAK